MRACQPDADDDEGLDDLPTIPFVEPGPQPPMTPPPQPDQDDEIQRARAFAQWARRRKQLANK